MHRTQPIHRQQPERKLPFPAPIDNASAYLASTSGLEQLSELPSRKTQRKIGGLLLSVHGDVQLPVKGAHIEIHAVAPLKRVANELPTAVLAHCRTLLLEAVNPINLYQSNRHVADAPLLSFADVQNLRAIPGYELLAAAARSQEDAFFRRLLGSNPAIAQLLLCYFHPASFPVTHAANAVTNEVGGFHCTLLEPANADDIPGYLFIARRKISSSLYITLYNPTPATWYTHWDWPEDKAVILRTRHPSAQRAN